MPKIINSTTRRVFVVSGGSATEVESDSLSADVRERGHRASDGPLAVEAGVLEAGHRATESVTAAVLGQANETGRRAVETITNQVTGVVSEAGQRATETATAALAVAEPGRRASDATTAIVIPVEDAARRATETIANEVTAVVTEAGDRATETITNEVTAIVAEAGDRATETITNEVTAIVAEAGDRATDSVQATIIAATESGRRAGDTETAIANYAGYANANVSTSGWASAANALGNNTGNFSSLTATSSGLAGLTSNTTSGTIVVGFADPAITDLAIQGNATLHVERSLVSSGTLPLNQSANLSWQYSTNNGSSWTNFQAADTGAVAKSTLTVSLALSYTQVNQLQIRATGSVTSGSGLSAQLQARFYRAWITFTASGSY